MAGYEFDYGATDGINDRLSRIEALVDDDSTVLAEYKYLDLGGDGAAGQSQGRSALDAGEPDGDERSRHGGHLQRAGSLLPHEFMQDVVCLATRGLNARLFSCDHWQNAGRFDDQPPAPVVATGNCARYRCLPTTDPRDSTSAA